MCPLKYLYHVLIFLLSSVLLSTCTEWSAVFDPSAVTVKAASKQRVSLVLSGLSDETIRNINEREYVQLRSEHDHLASVKDQENMRFFEVDRVSRSWNANFDVNGVFLGE